MRATAEGVTMVKKKKVTYTGILAKPMKKYGHGMASALQGQTQANSENEANEKNNKQLVDRFAALYKYYGVEPKDPAGAVLLAYYLAADHVLGFQWKDPDAKGPGAPSVWKGIKSVELYADVKKLAAAGQSDLNACAILADKKKYAERYGNFTKENLHRRYLDARNNFSFLEKIINDIQAKKGPAASEDYIINGYALREKQPE